MRSTQTTVSYVATGPRVVELLNVPCFKCAACGQLEIHVSARNALEACAKTLRPDHDRPPRLVHTSYWRMADTPDERARPTPSNEIHTGVRS